MFELFRIAFTIMIVILLIIACIMGVLTITRILSPLCAFVTSLLFVAIIVTAIAYWFNDIGKKRRSELFPC